MPLFNVDFFFAASTFYGWSERLFFVGATLTDAFTAAVGIKDLRRAWLPNSCGISYIRASTPGKPPDSFLDAFTSDGIGTYMPVTGAITMPIDTRVLVDLNATNVLKNRKFAGGLFDQDCSGDTFVPTSTWNTAFLAWGAALLTSGWVAASTYKAAGPPQTYAAISEVAASGFLANRKSGRPFGLRRGRRKILLSS